MFIIYFFKMLTGCSNGDKCEQTKFKCWYIKI